jgi:hyperosmotically inducible periplasmic protein
MIRRMIMVLTLALAVDASAPHGLAQSSADRTTIDAIRSKLLRLPYYGVFDFLAFSYDKGTVTLSGYAYHVALKADAERAVKQVARVDDVINKIEELPVSPMDDELRWKTYYAIYTDPFLSRYAPGGGMLWGHQHRVPLGRFGSAARFPGVEPVGNYPIAIIVKNGHITLMGEVDSDADKTMAGMKARGVPGAFGVENELTVEMHK